METVECNETDCKFYVEADNSCGREALPRIRNDGKCLDKEIEQ